MLNHLKKFLSNKVNAALVIVLLLILSGVGFAVNRFLQVDPASLPTEEVDLEFDPSGVYAILEPRRDGNAINLNIFRVASYESINYELAYQSAGSTADEGIGLVDRGVQGTIEAKDGYNPSTSKKSEYRQEILFGTCSKGDTFSIRSCVFDKNVENGTLILKIKKPYVRGDKKNTIYKMITNWHLQKPDVALGVITSADNHFKYVAKASEDELSIIGFTLVNDLTGAPKLPTDKKVLGKAYAMNLPTAKTFPAGELTIEIFDVAPQNAQIGRFNETENKWDLLETKIDGNKLTASSPGAGIFAVFTNSN